MGLQIIGNEIKGIISQNHKKTPLTGASYNWNDKTLPLNGFVGTDGDSVPRIDGDHSHNNLRHVVLIK